MKFKKWIAVLLALMMLLSLLAGCAKKDDDDEEEEEKTSTTAATEAGDETKPEKDPEGTKAPEKDPVKKPTKATKGETAETKAPETDEPEEPEEPEENEILDEPEVVVDLDALEELYADVELTIDGETADIVIGAVDNDDGSIIYLEGEMDSEYRAMIVEMDADDEWVIYSRAKKSDAFKLDDTLTEYDAEEALEVVDVVLQLLLIEDWSDICDGLQKVKAANKNVYTYEMLLDDEVVGTVSVDKKTGVVTEIEAEIDGAEGSMTVNDFSITDAKIPSYTKAEKEEPEESEILDEPEVVVDAAEIDELYADVELTVAGETVEVAVGAKLFSDGSGVIYLEGEMGDGYRAVILEDGEDGEVIAYSRTKKSDAFKQDDSFTEADVEEILGLFETVWSMLVVEDWSEVGEEFKKIESANKDVYTYEVSEDGEVMGTISVDKETGILTAVESEEVTLKLNDFSITDAKIPNY